MKTKKFSAEWFLNILITISVTGLAIVIASSLINYFSFSFHQTLKLVFWMGILVMMMPVVVLQFIMPAGLLSRFDIQISFLSKIMFYLVIFPFVDVLVISALDEFFHFLPTYQEYEMGSMIEKWQSQIRKIIGITYVSIICAGLLFRIIIIFFGDKTKAKKNS